MKLVEFVPPVKHPLWKLCLQMGITGVIVKVNPTLTGLPDPWRYETLKTIVDGLKAEGLTVVGLEGDPFDMTSVKQFGEQGITSAMREETLAHYRELLESMARLGIRLLCYNFMVGPGWSRTGVREVRGGAKATYFSLIETENAHTCVFGKENERTGVSVLREMWRTHTLVRSKEERTGVSVLRLDKAQVWANYEYFIKSVMPTAEKCGVRMGLHPDDPCLPALGGYARIFETVADYDRAYAICPSPSNAVTYCQANFKLMLMGERTLLSVRDDDETHRSVRSPRRWRTDTLVRSRTHKSVRSPDDATQALIETARHFGTRIAFIHVRDVEGDKTDFTELFHDQGTTDQFALMRVCRELGLDVPVRADHVPEMEGDRKIVADCIPGYFTLGRLFANGYLKALLQGTESTRDIEPQ